MPPLPPVKHRAWDVSGFVPCKQSSASRRCCRGSPRIRVRAGYRANVTERLAGMGLGGTGQKFPSVRAAAECDDAHHGWKALPDGHFQPFRHSIAGCFVPSPLAGGRACAGRPEPCRSACCEPLGLPLSPPPLPRPRRLLSIVYCLLSIVRLVKPLLSTKSLTMSCAAGGCFSLARRTGCVRRGKAQSIAPASWQVSIPRMCQPAQNQLVSRPRPSGGAGAAVCVIPVRGAVYVQPESGQRAQF